MTSLLYNAETMSNKPNNPDELILIDRQFSLRTAWRVCRWLFLAAAISALCDWVYPKEFKQLPFGSRVAMVLAEFAALALWYFDVQRWMRGQDELQRRITQASLFFAVSVSFFFFLLWTELDAAGFFHQVFGRPFMNNTWGICSVADVFLLISGFYGFGYLYFRRRFK